MEAPISASQGAMRSLPRKLESLLSGSKHKLREVEKKKLRVLQADLQEIIDKYLIEPSEVVFPASTANSWMKDVRDLSYDIDDFIYELAHVVGGGARISVVQKPPRFKISLFPEKLRRRRWVTDEISRLRTRVEEAIRLHKECLSNCKWWPIITGQPPPSPCGRLVGVDSSIQQLCDLLANDGQPGHRVVSIVGAGGVGKTTLAREVYRRLGGQFQCLAFVRTSPKADMKGLLTSLLSQVRRRRHVPDDALDVHKLVVNINEHLRDKTYLIVIEDLWALSTWDLVNRALPKGNSRSRILTTTEVDVIAQTCCADNCKFIPAQKEDISKYIHSEKEDKPKYMPSKEKNIPMYMRTQIENNSKYIIKKEPLSEDESRELFSNRAFGKQAECPPGIKEVSSEIIKKSGGLSLGISILAGLLAHHPASSIEQWNYISNSLSSDLTTHASLENINQVLNIGYDNLPHHLKACMLYLCLYEEDCIIWKDDLVKQWIAEGFISVVKGEDEEEVARSYFDELVNRGMVQPVDTNCSDEIMSCTVHHMVLHFIRDKSMEENFCIVIDHSQTTIRLADKVRRLAFHLGDVEHATPPGPENMILSKVRSVSFIGFHKCMPSVGEFRFLQVLNLKLLAYPDNMMTHNLPGSDDPSGNLTGSDDLTDNLSEPGCVSYNLSEISKLFRLRYFHLDAFHMSVALPTQMQQLKDLVAWEIDAEVAAVPSDIVDMPSLLYLRIPSKAHLPTGIGHMTSLRTLGVLDLSKNSTEDIMSLTGLTNLQDLRLTCCTLQPDNLEKNLECLGTVIPKLSNLKCVTLVPAVSTHFNSQHDVGASSMRTSWNALLPALLQRLELSRRCCHFSSLPGWIKELTKLCSLKISVRKVSKEDVFILKGLPSLFALSLFIWTAPAGRIIFDNDGFSVLKYFKFVCAAPCLKFLDGAMPNVRKLKLGFNANRMEQYNLDAARFERLTGLNEISIKIGATSVDEGERNSAHSVLTDAIGMHPSTPIINVHWVDWNFCGEDEKHNKPLEELRGQTSQKQYVTTVESSDLIFKKEAKLQASALIDTHIVERSDEHGKSEKNLEEDAKKQPDTRTYAAPDTTLHLQNIDLKLPLSEKHNHNVKLYKTTTTQRLPAPPTPYSQQPANQESQVEHQAMDLATGALGSLLPKLVQLLDDEYNRLKSLRKDVEFLERELTSMHAVLRKVAEVPRDQLDEQVRLWANEVRELSYNMEDVVDRFLVRVQGPDDPVASSHKLKRLMKKMAELFSEGKTRHQIAHAIKDIKGQIEDVPTRRDRYRIDDIVANPAAITTVDPRLLALYKDQKDLVGIQEASVELINKLADGNGDVSMQHLKILSILGFGGLGKTTLAKAVYDWMKEQFECTAFVSVGRNPDLKKFVKNILFELDKQKYMSFNEAMFNEKHLIDELRGLLQNKRYFIVIDDIWDTPTWEIVRCAFVDSNRGSRIVTTTRMFEVAATANDVYTMKPLSDENSKELFHKRLFFGKNRYPYNPPVELYEKILRKCGGVPLAIITIASLLAGKPSEEWPMVYNSIGFGYGDNKEVENTRKILLFSYYDLPCHLRTCLLYLSIYPEDYMIRKDILIWKWVAEGFVHEEHRRGLFEVGERYFTELINRNMIQPEEWMGKIYGCRVHDMVLDMICLLSEEENFVTIFDPEEQNTSSKIHPRRLASQKRVIEHDHLDNTRTPQVRSFNVTGCHVSVMPPLSGFEALRVLAIENCTFMKECHFQLETLGRLHQLRYLGLRNTPIGELPEEIGDLRFLQTLDLRESDIEALPESVILLTQLKRLRAGGYDRTISVPDGMGNLTSLEELVLGNVINSPNFVKELGKLTELRNLEIIEIELTESWMCKAMVESLCNLQKIQVLYLYAYSAKLDWEGYVPPAQLRDLTLWTKYSRLPTWINSSLLPNLVHLVIRPGDAMEAHDLVTLGEFPELLGLGIYGRVDDTPVVMGGDAFPRLRRCFMSAPCRFLPGAMPSLERTEFYVHVRALKEANFDLDFGTLENLPCLRHVGIICDNTTAKEVDEVEAAVRHAVDIHPNHPILELTRLGQVVEEEKDGQGS